MSPPGEEVIRHSWSESQRFLPRTFLRPLQRFLGIEAAGGIVMLVAAALALAWANSPWHEAYDTLWETGIDVSVGELLHLDLSLREWVNDALMAVFFLVVGLEIKRELVTGELRDPRAAGLPAIAALGGMIVPALIYLFFNAGGEASRGWGIPMATDIAFAAGVVALLGRRVPSGAKLFLLTLAIVDDLGAIAVIAVFYTDTLSLGWLAVAVGAVLAAAVLQRVDVRSLVPYVTLGVLCWLSLHESGVHATLAGVAFGFLTPCWSFHDPARFPDTAQRLVDGMRAAHADGQLKREEYERDQARLRDMVRLATETEAPLDRIEHKLTPWVSFGIVPLFALANAGVRLAGDGLLDGAGDEVVLGVALGLVVGKTIGVFSATWIAVRLGVGRLPQLTTWRHLLGLAMCAGIGFTVALFVAGLSFTDPALTASAKLGILVGSAVAGLAGYAFLRAAPAIDHEEPDLAEASERVVAPTTP